MISSKWSPLVLYLAILTASLVAARSSIGSYAPVYVKCPFHPLIRPSDTGICLNEYDYVLKRKLRAKSALYTYLDRVAVPGLDYKSLLHKSGGLNIGVAFSGGGFRSLLVGAGAIAAMDGRPSDPNCQTDIDSNMNGASDPLLDGEASPADVLAGGASRVRGLLQATTYFSGLSGGSWLIGSFLLNNMVPVTQLARCSALWDLSLNISSPSRLDAGEFAAHASDNSPESSELDPFNYWISGLKNTEAYYMVVNSEVDMKRDAGFLTSVTDYWSRLLSRKLIHEKGDNGVVWSDIRHTPSFRRHEAPFPIAIALAYDPAHSVHSTRSTIVEFTPFEFGSWDRNISQFSDIRYLGTTLNNGKPVGPYQCVNGYENASFVMATSSSLFNDLLMFLIRHASGTLQSALSKLQSLTDGISVPWLDREYALYPNPFYHTRSNPRHSLPESGKAIAENGVSGGESNIFTESKVMFLGDGGQDGQNLPLDALFRPERALDIVIAVDSSSDSANYPNGSAIYRSSLRYADWKYHHVDYPEVPPEFALVKLNPEGHPRFFGCSAKSFPRLREDPSLTVLPPLLAYVPNRYYTFSANTSTLRLTYSRAEAMRMLENGYYIMSDGGSPDWPRCLACAIVSRELYRQQVDPPAYCRACFRKYCVN